MRCSQYVVALFAAVMLLPTTASAVIIDSFDDFAVASADIDPSFDSFVTFSGSFLGTVRTVFSQWYSGPNSVDTAIDVGGDSLYRISTGADTHGASGMFWPNIGGVDLTAAATLNAISLAVEFWNFSADVTIIVTDSLGGESVLTTLFAGNILAPTSIDFLFADFVGSADFTNVAGINFAIGNLDFLPTESLFPLTDIQIDRIESTFVPVVPEPGTAILLGGGLLALALRRRQL